MKGRQKVYQTSKNYTQRWLRLIFQSSTTLFYFDPAPFILSISKNGHIYPHIILPPQSLLTPLQLSMVEYHELLGSTV